MRSLCISPRLFAVVLAVGLAPALGSAWQDQSSHTPPVIKTNTRLVIVDVVATDAKGQPVKDLEPKDFSVFENAKQQRISDFAFHHPEEMRTVAAQQLPPHVVSNAPQFQAGSMNVILFDTVNGDFTEHAYAKDQLVKFLSSSELNQPLAIFALESQLRLLHDFSTNAAKLKASIASYTPPAQRSLTESIESRASVFSNAGNFHTTERGIETTLNQLNALAKILKGYPGRKNLIWLSESFPLSLFPETSLKNSWNGQDLPRFEHAGGTDPADQNGASVFENLQKSRPFSSYSALVKKVSDALMDAQVAVYPVDAGALGRDSH